MKHILVITAMLLIVGVFAVLSLYLVDKVAPIVTLYATFVPAYVIILCILNNIKQQNNGKEQNNEKQH